MSYLSTLIPNCPNLQEGLNDVFVSCLENGILREQLPFLQFLTSQANAGNLQQRILPGSGKVRTIELIYNQRLSTSAVNRNVSNPKCDATSKKGQCVEVCTIDPDQNINVDCLIEANDLRYNCQDNPSYVIERVNELVDVLDRAIADDISAKAVTLLGNYAGDVLNQNNSAIGGTQPYLNVSTSYGGVAEQLSNLTYQTINTAAMQTGYCDQKVIFGGIQLYNYFQSSAFAGCCSQYGFDLRAAWEKFGVATMYDRRLATAFGGNQYSILTQPGALQLVAYTQNQWTDGMPSEYHSHSHFSTVIVSPRTSIPMDLTIKDDCGAVHINLTATVDLKAMPSDVFAVGDVYEGVNFVNGIEVV